LPEIRGIQKFSGFFQSQTGQKSVARQPVWKIFQPHRPVWKISPPRRPVGKTVKFCQPVWKTVKMRQPDYYFAYRNSFFRWTRAPLSLSTPARSPFFLSTTARTHFLLSTPARSQSWLQTPTIGLRVFSKTPKTFEFHGFPASCNDYSSALSDCGKTRKRLNSTDFRNSSYGALPGLYR
jgi:hypothetical protein